MHRALEPGRDARPRAPVPAQEACVTGDQHVIGREHDEVVLDVGGALARWDGRAWQPIMVDPWFGGGQRSLDVSAIAALLAWRRSR